MEGRTVVDRKVRLFGVKTKDVTVADDRDCEGIKSTSLSHNVFELFI